MEFTQKDVDVLNTRIEQTSDPEEKAALIKIKDEITEILSKKAIVAPRPQAIDTRKLNTFYKFIIPFALIFASIGIYYFIKNGRNIPTEG